MVFDLGVVGELEGEDEVFFWIFLRPREDAAVCGRVFLKEVVFEEECDGFEGCMGEWHIAPAFVRGVFEWVKECVCDGEANAVEDHVFFSFLEGEWWRVWGSGVLRGVGWGDGLGESVDAAELHGEVLRADIAFFEGYELWGGRGGG